MIQIRFGSPTTLALNLTFFALHSIHSFIFPRGIYLKIIWGYWGLFFNFTPACDQTWKGEFFFFFKSHPGVQIVLSLHCFLIPEAWQSSGRQSDSNALLRCSGASLSNFLILFPLLVMATHIPFSGLLGPLWSI